MEQKKVSKLGWKCYLTKSCSILFKLSHFLDKVSDKNTQKFQLNPTTFYWIKFSSNDYDIFLKNCEANKVS